ncbi:hypothetical protein L6Q96_13830 [Candidatus Binatia bacterium]|nr:hypothetical protein [Candidatus Binatia bacterium]
MPVREGSAICNPTMVRAQRRSAPGRWSWLVAIGLTAIMTGCGTVFWSPTPAAVGVDEAITLRDVQVEAAGAHRAVLLHLSQTPSQVRYGDSRRPASITIEAWGPPGNFDLPERTLPQVDDLVSQVRVSREEGCLKVTIDMQADELPQYTVHEMADWVMIRVQGAGQ